MGIKYTTLILNFNSRNRFTTKIVIGIQFKEILLPIIIPEIKIIPMTAGLIALKADLTIQWLRISKKNLLINITSNPDGKNIPVVSTIAPGIPAIL